MSTLISSLQYCARGPTWCNRKDKEIKSVTIEKEMDLIIYIENPRNL